MKQSILDHFQKVDPILFQVAQQVNISDLVIKDSSLFFTELCDHIISQQLNGKVSALILHRFQQLFPKERITPERLLLLSDIQFRSVGLSTGKTAYLRDLAYHVCSQQLPIESLSLLKDEEVITQLIQVKGVGRWTAEMFLIFTLGRENVFSHGDLGLKKGLAKVYQLQNPSAKDVESIVSMWSPYKSYGSRVLWESLTL